MRKLLPSDFKDKHDSISEQIAKDRSCIFFHDWHVFGKNIEYSINFFNEFLDRA